MKALILAVLCVASAAAQNLPACQPGSTECYVTSGAPTVEGLPGAPISLCYPCYVFYCIPCNQYGIPNIGASYCQTPTSAQQCNALRWIIYQYNACYQDFTCDQQNACYIVFQVQDYCSGVVCTTIREGPICTSTVALNRGGPRGKTLLASIRARNH